MSGCKVTSDDRKATSYSETEIHQDFKRTRFLKNISNGPFFIGRTSQYTISSIIHHQFSANALLLTMMLTYHMLQIATLTTNKSLKKKHFFLTIKLHLIITTPMDLVNFFFPLQVNYTQFFCSTTALQLTFSSSQLVKADDA